MLRVMLSRPVPNRLDRQRGLSLVELMVGIALGLFIVAGASMLVSTQLGENRRLLLETQIHQDLRATADIITRELRRAGRVRDVEALQRVWFAGGPPAATPTNGAVVVTGGVDTAEVCYSYQRITGADFQPLGYRFVAASGALGGGIQARLAAGGWQDLTDRSTLNVTAFRVVLTPSAPLLALPEACVGIPGGGWDCQPTVQVRDVVVEIEGQARTDASVRRSMRSQVRLRNDLVVNPGPPGASPCAPVSTP